MATATSYPSSQPEKTPKNESAATVRAAIIGGVATVLASIIAASVTAFQATKEAGNQAREQAVRVTQQAFSDLAQRISGGTIGADTAILNQIGRTYTVNQLGVGHIKITFDAPFDDAPVAMATVHQIDNGKFGIGATIDFTDKRSVVVTTRNEAIGTPVASQFSFMVLESTRSSPPK
jgi:hypothetical protein